jgi:hypothetical protein
MRLCLVLGPAPVNSQKAVMTCECSAIPFPRSLLSCFCPRTRLVKITIGEKMPNFDSLAIVHCAGRADVDVVRVGRRHVTAEPEKELRDDAGMGLAVTAKAVLGLDMTRLGQTRGRVPAMIGSWAKDGRIVESKTA